MADFKLIDGNYINLDRVLCIRPNEITRTKSDVYYDDYLGRTFILNLSVDDAVKIIESDDHQDIKYKVGFNV